MRAARSMFNSLFSTAAASITALPPSAVSQVYGMAESIANFVGRPLPERLAPGVLQGTLSLLSDALRRTPYGFPLEWAYPLAISLSSSSYCPFACSNCYSNSGVARERGQEHDRMQVFAKVAATKTPIVIISGGEPLVADGLKECLKLLLDSGKFILISTNALVDSYLEVARENLGSLYFILPVWGDRKRHNARRGTNSFERVEKNLALLNTVGQKPYIFVVLPDHDLTIFEDVERLTQSHTVDTITIGRRIDAGRVEAAPLNFDPGHLRKIRCWQKRLQKHVRLVVCDLPGMKDKKALLFQRLLG